MYINFRIKIIMIFLLKICLSNPYTKQIQTNTCKAYQLNKYYNINNYAKKLKKNRELRHNG
jgi:hypothetical protein